MGKLQVVVDGQYGSCGKGHVAAQLAMPALNPGGVSAVRVAGPNAGHSAVDAAGRKWPLRQIPVAAVVNPDARLYIAAGSEVDISVLLKEVEALEAGGHDIRSRLTIDPMATILETRHQHVEAAAGLVASVGSTGKGIGAARADRIMRTATVVRDTDLQDLCNIADVASLLAADLTGGANCQIEGTQGHGLGLHHSNYPQTTSSDCRAIDFLAMAGVSPWQYGIDDLEVWVTLRPYPIRVAGNSGPMHGETTWEALGLPQERTTVTQKVRRVGTWDGPLAAAAVRANGGPSEFVHIALMMMDQVSASVAGMTDSDDLLADSGAARFIDMVEGDCRQDVDMVGTSDRTVVWL